MKIVLGRHGRPKLSHRIWLAPRQLGCWIEAFDPAGVDLVRVPRDTLKTAALCNVVVVSTLQRSVQSAAILAPSKVLVTEALLREAGMPHTQWPFPRLPVRAWLLFFRIAWFCGYAPNSESLPLASARAGVAAERLIDLARQHGSVFVVGHGIFTMLIAKQLLLKGWSGSKRPRNKYWGCCVYHAR